jgi:hypothetical protein
MDARLIAAALLLTGCASDASYIAYLEAQRAAQTAAQQGARPLVRIVAQDGATITGLAGIEINLPVEAPRVEQQRPSEWAGVIQTGLGVFGAVGGIFASGKAAKDLAIAVGTHSAAIAGQIQAPAANVTTSTVTNESNSRNVATTTTTTNEADSRNTQTSQNTNTTTSTSSVSNSNNPITNNTTTTP